MNRSSDKALGVNYQLLTFPASHSTRHDDPHVNEAFWHTDFWGWCGTSEEKYYHKDKMVSSQVTTEEHYPGFPPARSAKDYRRWKEYRQVPRILRAQAG